VRGDQSAQLAGRRPGRRPAAGGPANIAQQPPCPRRGLREVIGGGDRTVKVPACMAARACAAAAAAAPSASSAPGATPAGLARALDRVSSCSGSGFPAPGASASRAAVPVALAGELCGGARGSRLSGPGAAPGASPAVQMAGDAFRSQVAWPAFSRAASSRAAAARVIPAASASWAAVAPGAAVSAAMMAAAGPAGGAAADAGRAERPAACPGRCPRRRRRGWDLSSRCGSSRLFLSSYSAIGGRGPTIGRVPRPAGARPAQPG
jgi:hypothetical protein